jgi:ABC-type glycerol-3-phosphate transport system permease component
VFLYVPLACFVFILLFPFYWMAITSFKPNAELYDYKTYNPVLDRQADARPHPQALIRHGLSALAADDHVGRRCALRSFR